MRDSGKEKNKVEDKNSATIQGTVSVAVREDSFDTAEGLQTFAGAFVGLQLHEVRARAGEGLVEVDETEVRAGTFAVAGGTRVGG